MNCAKCIHGVTCYLRRSFSISMGVFNGVGHGAPYTERPGDSMRWFDGFAELCSFYEVSG